MRPKSAGGETVAAQALVRRIDCRMGRRMGRLLLLTLIATAAWLAGCSTTAAPQMFSMLPASSAALASAPLALDERETTPLPVAVEAIAVPLAVDQPQWLLRLPDQRVVLLEQTLWASPLRDEIRTALRDRLAQRWATTSEQPPVWRLSLALSRFDSALGREAWWEGHWTLRPGGAAAAAGAPTISCALRIHERAGAGLPALAEAHRRALLRLADQIGARLRVAPSATPPACAALDG